MAALRLAMPPTSGNRSPHHRDYRHPRRRSSTAPNRVKLSVAGSGVVKVNVYISDGV